MLLLPPYRDLPVHDGMHTSWGVFGPDDQLGTVNLLDADAVQRGLGAVGSGRVHSLNWDVCRPDPNPWRPVPRRVQRTRAPLIRDDYIEELHLQFSTQWDGLRHIALDSGFYNGVAAVDVDDPASTTLGIHAWAEHGIVGRGVLVDVAGSFARAGRPFDPSTPAVISVDDLEAVMQEQEVTLARGDVLLVRTGWIEWYESLDAGAREQFAQSPASAGLESSPAVAEWLWDHHVSAIACDNIAVESMPSDSNFPHESLHGLVLAALGMPLGELFALDALGRDCASERRWSFMFAAAPLNLHGGVGSPGNALAIV